MQDQQIAIFDQVPRLVPTTLLPSLYFGGLVSQFGWFFLGFGMIFVLLFTFSTDFAAAWDFRGTVETRPGVVQAAHELNFRLDEQKVYRIKYTFTDDRGIEHASIGYTHGHSPSQGDAVTVEYPLGAPNRSRMQGGYREPMGEDLLALMPVIFPLIGATVVGVGLFKGRKRHRLLRSGRLVTGKLVDKQATNIEINDQIIYKMYYEFTDEAGVAQRMFVRTHHTEPLERQPEQMLLYDTARPSQAILLDNLPSKVSISEYGHLRNDHPIGSALCLVVPIGFLVINIFVVSYLLP